MFDRSAADAVGEVTSCGDDQLTSFAALAKAAYNDVTTWDSTTVSIVGVIIGKYISHLNPNFKFCNKKIYLIVTFRMFCKVNFTCCL